MRPPPEHPAPGQSAVRLPPPCRAAVALPQHDGPSRRCCAAQVPQRFPSSRGDCARRRAGGSLQGGGAHHAAPGVQPGGELHLLPDLQGAVAKAVGARGAGPLAAHAHRRPLRRVRPRSQQPAGRGEDAAAEAARGARPGAQVHGPRAGHCGHCKGRGAFGPVEGANTPADAHHAGPGYHVHDLRVCLQAREQNGSALFGAREDQCQMRGQAGRCQESD
mmetsp:Transcript_30274/g.47389  ORF Transcript_30274/g.47389 Transcript_30274/m.47389 type:complete len:219 (+) Transcript_30274:451-1107(+)